MKVPLLNFVRGPGVPLLNFEGGPRVQLLNFREVPRPTFKLRGGSRIQGPEVLIPLLHHAVLLKQFFFAWDIEVFWILIRGQTQSTLW